MKPAALREELAQGRIRPAYLVAGEEVLQRDESIRALREVVLGAGPAEFNHDRFEGESASGAALLDALRTLPVMAERRLVELREPDASRAASRGLLKALTEAVALLDDGESGTVLVVAASRVDGRTSWARAFPDDAVVRCDPPRGARETAAWVREEARRQGVTLARGAAEALAERIGPQLLALRGELEKVALLAGEGAPVTSEHVALATSDVAEEPIWDLTDAIGEGRAGDAIALLSRLLRGGAPPPVVLGALASHFRRLAHVADGARTGGPSFVVRKLEQQTRRYGAGRLRACLRAIHETDTALKGASPLRPGLVLERLVLNLSA